MNVFLSWSGEKSRAVAEEFNEWIQCVLQSVQPWISTSGIEGGSLWFDEISTQLNETGIGIIFLTQENKNSPWIMFESGALAKGLKVNRVCTLLIDLEPQDINNPLANFNHTLTEKQSILKLTKMLNNMLSEKGLTNPVLDKVFDKYWPDLESAFQRIENQSPPIGPEPPRGSEDKLDEILLSTRKISSRMDRVERDQEIFNSIRNKFNSNLENWATDTDSTKLVSDWDKRVEFLKKKNNFKHHPSSSTEDENTE